MGELLLEAFGQTLVMVVPSTIFSVIFGFIIAIVLVVTDSNGLRSNKAIYKCIDAIVNVLRGFPFVILMVAIIPFTRAIMGTSLGEKAAIVPLTIAAAPFVARIFESALKEVDPGVIGYTINSIRYNTYSYKSYRIFSNGRCSRGRGPW